jgi:hypothetical protein
MAFSLSDSVRFHEAQRNFDNTNDDAVVEERDRQAEEEPELGNDGEITKDSPEDDPRELR